MVGELFAGVGLFKTMLDTAKSLKDMTDASMRASVAIDLQQKILDAQRQQSELIDEVRELQRKVASYESWVEEKDRYALKDFGAGTFAYALKKDKANGEPDHLLCATCFQEKRKSILQFLYRNHRSQQAYQCNTCKLNVMLGAPLDREERGPRPGENWKTV